MTHENRFHAYVPYFGCLFIFCHFSMASKIATRSGSSVPTTENGIVTSRVLTLIAACAVMLVPATFLVSVLDSGM